MSNPPQFQPPQGPQSPSQLPYDSGNGWNQADHTQYADQGWQQSGQAQPVQGWQQSSAGPQQGWQSPGQPGGAARPYSQMSEWQTGFQGGPPTPKKSWYQRWWGIAILTVLGLMILGAVLGSLGGQSPSDTQSPSQTAPVTTQQEQASSNPEEANTQGKQPAETKPAETKTAETKPAETKPAETKPAETKKAEAVPAEGEQALAKAQNYLQFMAFSKKGLYQQLTSDAGEKFPADAAKYAVDHVDVDWNEQALKKAESYRDTMQMSKAGIKDQLSSDIEGFTDSEVEYAISHLK